MDFSDNFVTLLSERKIAVCDFLAVFELLVMAHIATITPIVTANALIYLGDGRRILPIFTQNNRTFCCHIIILKKAEALLRFSLNLSITCILYYFNG
ncbi:hypothetical protein [Photorhabdus sp. RM96S]|uniref:hypothetical protein n=1 Tax=Photorhabdus sp. RM96S TaxID=3342822 RepID=UPI0036DC239B